MVPASVFLIALPVLIVWTLVLTELLRRPLATGIARRDQAYNSFLEQLHCVDPFAAAAIQDNRFENTSNGVPAMKREDRAASYLRRIIALSGATQVGNSYVLDVGTTRFSVSDRYVGRLQDVTDPKCIYRETCYYSAHKKVPKAEQTASVLLLLKNNPALFDKWVAQRGLMFKADGMSVQPHAVIDW